MSTDDDVPFRHSRACARFSYVRLAYRAAGSGTTTRQLVSAHGMAVRLQDGGAEMKLAEGIELYLGDCREILPTLSENSIDSCVTDPPYHLTSIVKRFGDEGAAPAQFGKDVAYARASAGFMGKQWDGLEMPEIDSGLGHWLAGFADGEGCFTTRKNGKGYVCEFIIHVRGDDAPILRAIHKATGIGDLDGPRPRDDGGGPMVKWIVRRQLDCAKLVLLFRAFPLRAKKSRDFEIWASAVEEWTNHEPGTSWGDLASHAELLSAVKMYGSSFHSSQLFHYRWAKQTFRVLKPGGHLVVFGGTRSYHRLAAAIEDAGFEIRDSLMWIYGTGFPKSHDVSKGIDRAAGVEREVVGITNRRVGPKGMHRVDGLCGSSTFRENPDNLGNLLTAPATPEAAQWEGWGTALKPAFEPIILARKPLSEPTVAANVLRWGTGAINVDGCRIEANAADIAAAAVPERNNLKMFLGDGVGRAETRFDMSRGRWPANVCHDGSDEVVGLFPSPHGAGARVTGTNGANPDNWKGDIFQHGGRGMRHGDSGSAARFFYSAKASKADRAGSKHPTVKPVALMRWLARLITPPDGVVLDPFAGSGTTGEAAFREGMRSILIERELEYHADIQRRLSLMSASPQKDKKPAINQSYGPLFEFMEVAE